MVVILRRIKNWPVFVLDMYLMVFEDFMKSYAVFTCVFEVREGGVDLREVLGLVKVLSMKWVSTTRASAVDACTCT